MVRDFTDNAKSELKSLITQVEDEKLCDFTDWVGDRWYDFEEWIGTLSLKEDLSNVNSYHRKVIDKNNTTLAELEKIFEEVYYVESGYHARLSEIITTCRAFNGLIEKLSDTILPGNGSLPDMDIDAMLAGPFEAYISLFDSLMDWELRLSKMLEEYRLKDSITDEDKDAFIELYEFYNEELKAKVDALLEKLPEDQIREIKYYVYSAEEPYRSMYLNELESYTLGKISGENLGYFTTYDNTINVDMTKEDTNPRGSYTTFFHESGHAIDYNYQNDGEFYSQTYRNSEGKSLQEVIYEDVENDIRNTIARYTTDPDEQEHLLEYIMGAKSVDIDILNETEKDYLEKIKNHYNIELDGEVNEAGSDVYGGVTNNIIKGEYGHTKDEYYWYDTAGEATYQQSRELWAEYYSYCMTGNEEALASLREHFPNASKFLDEMAASMVS